MLEQEAINTGFQLVVALLIAFIPWLIFARKREGFRSWTGLTLPTGRALKWTLGVFLVWSVISSAIYLVPDFAALASAEGTVAGRVRENGLSAETLMAMLLMALIKTGLTEEIVFRGVIGKRLVRGLGFWVGNTVQAVFFGAIHLLIFLVPGAPEFTLPLGAVMFFMPGLAGWLMGFLNEKIGNGSIVPGWLMHGFGNAISYPILAFLI